MRLEAVNGRQEHENRHKCSVQHVEMNIEG